METTITAAVAPRPAFTGNRPFPPAACPRTPSGSTMWPETPGSGSPTAGTTITWRAPRRTAVPGWSRTVGTVPGVCCAAAPGSTSPGPCAPRSATGTPLLLPTSTSVFVSPGHYPIDFLLFPFSAFYCTLVRVEGRSVTGGEGSLWLRLNRTLVESCVPAGRPRLAFPVNRYQVP
jgi:hypothetical protein